jgi:hypothetical protein
MKLLYSDIEGIVVYVEVVGCCHCYCVGLNKSNPPAQSLTIQIPDRIINLGINQDTQISFHKRIYKWVFIQARSVPTIMG